MNDAITDAPSHRYTARILQSYRNLGYSFYDCFTKEGMQDRTSPLGASSTPNATPTASAEAAERPSCGYAKSTRPPNASPRITSASTRGRSPKPTDRSHPAWMPPPQPRPPTPKL
jgi:hypothetical protein